MTSRKAGIVVGLVLLLAGCGGYDGMGFPRQRHEAYTRLPLQSQHNDAMVESVEATTIVNNAVALWGSTRRNVGSGVGYGPDDGAEVDLTLTVTPGNPARFVRLPMSQFMTGASGKMRVTIHAARADGASPSYMQVTCGNTQARADFAAASGVYDLVTVALDVDEVRSPGLLTDAQLTIGVGVDWSWGEGVEETITIRSVSAYELPGPDAWRWKDTTASSNKIGQQNYPLSPAMLRILLNNQHAIRSARSPRTILHRCFRTNKKTLGAGYDAGEDGLGDWIIRKPHGTTQIESIIGCDVNAGSADFRLSLWSIESILYDGQVTNFVPGETVTGQTSGARARLIGQNDAGATGVLYLGFVDGVFADNETILGESTGEALANGTLAGPVEMATDTQTISANVNQEFSIGSLVESEAEYWLRLDAKINSGSTTGYAVGIIVVPELGSDVTYKLPKTTNTEIEDDVLAQTWNNVKTTLEKIWARSHGIIMSDYRHLTGGQIETRTLPSPSISPYSWFDPSFYTRVWGVTKGIISAGVVYPSAGAKYLQAKVVVKRTDNSSVWKLDYTGMSGVPSYGDTVTGGTSGATGILGTDDLSSTISMYSVSGYFLSGETITFTGGATATVSGTQYKFDSDVKLKLVVYDGEAIGFNSVAIAEHEVSCSAIRHGAFGKITMRVPLTSVYENDYGESANGSPYCWALLGYTDWTGDHLVVDSYEVFEEPLLPGGFEMDLGDF